MSFVGICWKAFRIFVSRDLEVKYFLLGPVWDQFPLIWSELGIWENPRVSVKMWDKFTCIWDFLRMILIGIPGGPGDLGVESVFGAGPVSLLSGWVR